MDGEPFASPREQYDRLKSQIEHMEPFLWLLYHDYQIQVDQGFKLTFAVDFHEIWNYTQAQDEDLVKQIARAALFNGLGSTNPSVLLPPYVVELNDMITWVKARLIESASSGLSHRWLRNLNTIADNPKIRSALNEYSKTGQVTSDSVRALQQFMEEKGDELFLLISGVASKGLDAVRSLI